MGCGVSGCTEHVVESIISLDNVIKCKKPKVKLVKRKKTVRYDSSQNITIEEIPLFGEKIFTGSNERLKGTFYCSQNIVTVSSFDSSNNLRVNDYRTYRTRISSWDVDTLKCEKNVVGNYSTKCVCLKNDSSLIISTDDNTLCLFDLITKEWKEILKFNSEKYYNYICSDLVVVSEDFIVLADSFTMDGSGKMFTIFVCCLKDKKYKIIEDEDFGFPEFKWGSEYSNNWRENIKNCDFKNVVTSKTDCNKFFFLIVERSDEYDSYDNHRSSIRRYTCLEQKLDEFRVVFNLEAECFDTFLCPKTGNEMIICFGQRKFYRSIYLINSSSKKVVSKLDGNHVNGIPDDLTSFGMNMLKSCSSFVCGISRNYESVGGVFLYHVKKNRVEQIAFTKVNDHYRDRGMYGGIRWTENCAMFFDQSGSFGKFRIIFARVNEMKIVTIRGLAVVPRVDEDLKERVCYTHSLCGIEEDKGMFIFVIIGKVYIKIFKSFL